MILCVYNFCIEKEWVGRGRKICNYDLTFWPTVLQTIKKKEQNKHLQTTQEV